MRTRQFVFRRDGGEWVINNRTWEDVVRSNFTLALATTNKNDVETWELRNPSGGWHHPIHVHLVDFKILSRNGQPAQAYEHGPKDVVFLGENETIKLLIKFDGGFGKYMMHCHNLVHEDHDMMGQFVVLNGANVADDPFSGAGPQPARDPPLTRHGDHHPVRVVERLDRRAPPRARDSSSRQPWGPPWPGSSTSSSSRATGRCPPR